MCRGTEGDSGSNVPSESTPCGPLLLWAMLLATQSTKPCTSHKLLAGTAAADSVTCCSSPCGQTVKAEQQVCTALAVDVTHKPVGQAMRAPLFLDAFQESFGNCPPAEPDPAQLPRGAWVTSQICLELFVAFQFVHCLEYFLNLFFCVCVYTYV